MKEGTPEVGEASNIPPPSGLTVNRWISILDLTLRVVALLGTLGSAVAMATSDETLLFPTQFTLYRAEYDDLPALSFFVIANSVVCAYLALSIPLAIFHVTRSRATNSRLILIFFDTAMLGLLTAGASAASAIVYLAHKGNASANWLEICQQFNNFCEQISGSLIGSFGGIIVLILVIPLSAIALRGQ